MARKFAEYAAQREKKLSPEGREALEVFNHAHVLGNTIFDARKQRGFTQQTLATCSGVAQADISRIERGLITPTIPTLLRLIDALGARMVIELSEVIPLPSVPTKHVVAAGTAPVKRAAAAKKTTAEGPVKAGKRLVASR